MFNQCSIIFLLFLSLLSLILPFSHTLTHTLCSSSFSLSLSHSCPLLPLFLPRHWLTSAYILFAVPYFVYDIYAMFQCYWHKLRVKGHEVDNGPKPMGVAFTSYLRREFLMVLHHVVMVTVCFPVSVVTVAMDFFFSCFSNLI